MPSVSYVSSTGFVEGSMPYTAKFSRRFYDKLGDDVVNELVDWLNTVDLIYKTELKEHTEINLRRVEAVIRSEAVRIESKIDVEIANVRSEFKEGITELRSELKGDIATLRGEMASMRADLIKWMFVFWASTALIMFGLS